MSSSDVNVPQPATVQSSIFSWKIGVSAIQSESESERESEKRKYGQVRMGEDG